MNFEELKERFLTQALSYWERIKESSAYNQLRDRYENLSPAAQRGSLIGGAVLIALIILSFPFSYYSNSQTSVSEFEEKRSTIRELLKVTREASDVPDLAQPPPMDQLKNMADTQIRNANLLPEQVKSVEVSSAASKLIPQNLSSGSLIVTLSKLNLRQVVDLGYQLQAMNTSVKMQDLSIVANREDVHYFDVVYKLIALAVPSTPAPEPEPIAPPKRKAKPSSDEG